MTTPDLTPEWHRADNSGSILLYTLKQNGWRKGEPVMVNDMTIRIENENQSANDLEAIVDRVMNGLRATPAPTDNAALVEVKPLKWKLRSNINDCGHEWQEWVAENPISIIIIKDHTPFFGREAFSFVFGDYMVDETYPFLDSVDDAKAAAQLDYETRVRASLSSHAAATVVANPPKKIWAMDDGRWATFDPSSLTACVEYIRADLTTPPEDVGAWRPIETAPETGESVIVFCRVNGVVQAIYDRAAPGWTDAIEAAMMLFPTHWMPLPAPPDALAKHKDNTHE